MYLSQVEINKNNEKNLYANSFCVFQIVAPIYIGNSSINWERDR